MSLIRRDLVVSEQYPDSWRCSSPETPVCAESGRSLEDLREKMHDTIKAYLRGLVVRGPQIPEPSMGLDDFQQGEAAEWMVIRLRDGASNAQDSSVSPFPIR